MLVASARSFLGTYSAVALIAAGKLPASPNANSILAIINKVTLVETTFATLSTVAIVSLADSKFKSHLSARIPAVPMPQKACAQAATLHTAMAQRNPFL